MFPLSSSSSCFVLDCFPHEWTEDDDEHENDQEIPRLPIVVLVVVVALDCFPHQQTESDDDDEHDEEIPASSRYRPRGCRCPRFRIEAVYRFTTIRGGLVTQTDKRDSGDGG